MALVMVIEDEEALALLLKYNLEKEGFDVVWESSGNRALAAVEKYCPSVILLDWMLPELSGVEICKMIRNKPDIKDIPIIMLTAKGEEEDKIKGLSAGADGSPCPAPLWRVHRPMNAGRAWRPARTTMLPNRFRCRN